MRNPLIASLLVALVVLVVVPPTMVGVLSGGAAALHPGPDLWGEVRTDRDVYAPGQPVLIGVFVTNRGHDTWTLHFTSSCLSTFTVEDRAGKLWYSHTQDCLFVITEITLKPGETALFGRFSWPQVDNEGHQVPVPNAYIITGYSLSREYVVPGTKEIFIISPYAVLRGDLSNLTFVVALSAPHPPAGAASTIDVVAAVPVAASLARFSIEGLPHALLDVEAVVTDGVNVIVVAPGHLITFGGRGVNLVTRYFNDLPGSAGFPVRVFPSMGVCTTDARGNPIHCYRRQVSSSGQVVDYAYASALWDERVDRAGRAAIVLAGLSGYATRAMGELVALEPDMVLTGTGVVVQLVDIEGDGWYETFQVVDGTGGFLPTREAPFPHPLYVLETFAIGLSQPHGVVGGANTIDAVGAIPMAVREARLRRGTIWAALDIELVSLDATTILPIVSDLVALGGQGVNLVTRFYNPYMPIRVTREGVCTTDENGNILRCYSNRCIELCPLPPGFQVHGYRTNATVRERHVELVVGTSGYATRDLALLISRDQCSVDTGTGTIVARVDFDLDGFFDYLEIIDGTGNWQRDRCLFPKP